MIKHLLSAGDLDRTDADQPAPTTPDGRFTILMPHPERVFRSVLLSWHPQEWDEDSPWMRIFRNARAWVG